jgi:hypothetical protein
MNTLTPAWYMDIRKAETSEHMSLDLTRHLPRRLMVGTAVIVSDRPDILLPVIRKRWMRVIREVQRQLSSTLDRAKKHELTREVERLRSFQFTTQIDKPGIDALLIEPSQTVCHLPEFTSLYILTPLTTNQFLSAAEHAAPSTMVAVYGEHTPYEHALRSMGSSIPQYGEGTYPRL